MSLKSLIDRLFTKHMLISNCVGMCGCLALGDFLEQKIATRLRGNADMKRVGMNELQIISKFADAMQEKKLTKILVMLMLVKCTTPRSGSQVGILITGFT